MGDRPEKARLSILAWSKHQPRTEALAAELHGRLHFVHPERWPRTRWLLPFRYAYDAVRTWQILDRENPEAVLAVSPPIVAPLTAWSWCHRHRRAFAMDCHTEVFHSPRWRWALPLQRWLSQRATAVTLHTRESEEEVLAWTDRALFLPEDVPEVVAGEDAGGPAARARPRVLVGGSLDYMEPVAEEVEMARLVPEADVLLTGEPANVPAAVRARAPANAIFTGWLPHKEFMRELGGANVAAAFCLDPHAMNRAAFEAIGLGRALVLSDIRGLRERFGDAALYCANNAQAMAEAVRDALARQADLEEASRRIGTRLRMEHAAGIRRLEEMLASPRPRGRSARPQRVLMISQHPYPANPVLRRNVDAVLDAGADVDLLCTDYRPVPGVPARPGRLRVHTIPMSHSRVNARRYMAEYLGFFVRAMLRVMAISLGRRFDTVQVDTVPDFLVFCAWPARWRGARIVLFMYELMPEMTMARLGARRRHPLVRLAVWLERRSIAWADAVIVVNDACRRALEARGVQPRKLTVVPNTQPERVLPDATGHVEPCLVTHATLIKRYGVDVAIRALAELRRHRPDLTLTVLGEGEFEPALRQLAGNLGLADYVRFRGFLPWSDAMAVIRGCAVGIVPVLADGYGHLMLPMKLLDYAALGVPAVCSRLPAIEDYFPEDAVAYVPPGDVSALAREVDRLLSDRAAAARQTQRAREAAAAIGWDAVGPQYLAALGAA